MAYETDEHEDGDSMRCGHEPARPVTGSDTRRAVERMARITHLTDQSTAASQALGELVGAFAMGVVKQGTSEGMAEQMAHHYLDLLLPPEPDA